MLVLKLSNVALPDSFACPWSVYIYKYIQLVAKWSPCLMYLFDQLIFCADELVHYGHNLVDERSNKGEVIEEEEKERHQRLVLLPSC